MKLVDTNIFLNAINRDAVDCDSCCGALESLADGTDTWAASWTVVYEFMRVATHPGVFSKPLRSEEAWQFMQELFSRPNCIVLSETSLHPETLEQCLKEAPRVTGNMLHDFHLAVLMREHGISRILTLDRDFKAFPWVSVEQPD